MYYQQSPKKLVKHFQTDIENGLSESQVKQKADKFGLNTLPTPKKPSIILKFFSQFTDLLVIILLIASAIAFLLSEVIDALAILAIVLINASIGFIQELQAEKTIKALQEKETLYSMVLRDGKVQRIEIINIVPGDILLIEEGNKVPADVRIIEAYALIVDESILTGESTSVSKNSNTLSKKNIPIADRSNMIYKNTEVLMGRGKGIVVATGKNTEIGKIAVTLETTKKEKTPLTQELEKVAKFLTLVIGFIAFAIFIINYLTNVTLLQSLLISISLSVAAIPEGLPAIVTIVLSLGVKSLAEKETIVKRLASVETLGSVRIIATDKTGTLTQNKINVVKITLKNSKSYQVKGNGYEPTGNFFDNDNKIIDPQTDELLTELLESSTLANDASLQIENQETQVFGDTTEGALLVSALRANIDIKKLRKKNPRVYEVPFSSEKKMMSVIVKTGKGGKYLLISKGAPEVIIAKSKLSKDQKKKFINITKKLTHEGLRTLAIAKKTLSENQVKSLKNQNNISENGLELIGITGMHDPLRPEVKDALKQAKRAGIRTIMITGDHKDTARAIALQAGILSPISVPTANHLFRNNNPVLGEVEEDSSEVNLRSIEVLTDQQVENLTTKELAQKIKQGINVFARISPLSKLRIVEAIKSIPYTQVAVTGDGVNDAPALKAAHIGIAMGKTGTDLTREVADMVLADDNYATIVSAIEQGRVIYSNLVKFIRYLISCNLAEVLVVALGVISATPLPLFPIQILWINLVTDSLPALALGVDPPEADVMKLPPRDPSLGILHKTRLIYMSIEGIIIGLAVFILFLFSLNKYDYVHAQSMTFAALAISQLVHAFNNRSTRKSLFSLGLFTNKHLIGAVLISLILQFIAIETNLGNVIFKTASLNLDQWLLIGLVSAVPFIFVEIKKQLRFRIIS